MMHVRSKAPAVWFSTRHPGALNGSSTGPA
jgi:hypothetical protein